MDELRAELQAPQAREAALLKEFDNAQQTAQMVQATPTDLRTVGRGTTVPETLSGYVTLDQYPPSVVYDRDFGPLPAGEPHTWRDPRPHFNFSIDTSLHQQLLVEGTKVVRLSLKPAGLTTSFFKHENQSPSYMENPINLDALGLRLSGWIITAIAAQIMYKYFQRASGADLFDSG